MLFTQILLIVISLLGVIFGFLPQVDTLPPINGYDIDTALVQGVGEAYAFAHAIWPIEDVIGGALVLFAYYSLKMLLKFLLGHRAPAI